MTRKLNVFVPIFSSPREKYEIISEYYANMNFTFKLISSNQQAITPLIDQIRFQRRELRTR